MMRPYDWGDTEPRPAHRDPAFWLFLVLVVGSLWLAAYVGLGRLT